MSQTAGTLAYMAPEQIRGKGIGPWTDNYAFACLVCEILSGEPPFSTGDLRWQIIHEEPELSANLSETVQKALLCGLAKDPEERPVSAGALVEMLAGERQPEAGGVGPETIKSGDTTASTSVSTSGPGIITATPGFWNTQPSFSCSPAGPTSSSTTRFLPEIRRPFSGIMK
jgi:serine/threonine-protein kinase